MNYKYAEYNREERNLCSHLFRLLLMDHPNYKPLKEFVGDDTIVNPHIFSEVALIRDAYHIRADKVRFVDQMSKIIANQENLKDYRSYSDLPLVLREPNSTYPSQIRQKANKMEITLSSDELKLYGSMQGMFNAKPDLVICYNENLLIYEAKFTLGFDNEQLDRTNKIGEVWQSLLYKDLEFETTPNIQVLKLGLEKFKPDVSWSDVLKIAKKYLEKNDLSLVAISNAVTFQVLVKKQHH